MFLRSRRGWLLGTALFAVGCLSPTLPLPPPGDPTVSSTETAGLVRLTGSVQPQSEVFALNHTTNLIRGQYTESGAYDFTLEAQERDGISLWYVHGTVESPQNDFVLKLTPATP
ncbi:MAG: hypothetical protein WDO69_24625 [Pseudomonadota bacterium]